MKKKEAKKREKCPLKVTQLQRLRNLSFSAARVLALPSGVLPPTGPSHPPVSRLPSLFNPPAFVEHQGIWTGPWRQSLSS